MSTVESYIKKAKGVIDPHTKKTMRTVMWPPTDKVNSISITKRFPKGALDNMQLLAYDGETSYVVIRLGKCQYKIEDPNGS